MHERTDVWCVGSQMNAGERRCNNNYKIYLINLGYVFSWYVHTCVRM